MRYAMAFTASCLLVASFSSHAAPTVMDIHLGVGLTESKKNIAFYTLDSYQHPLEVQVAPSASLINGEFPSTAARFSASNQLTYTGFRSHKTEIDNLHPNTRYSYRIGNEEDGWTQAYEFSQFDSERFNFIVAGDPQIGATGFGDASVEDAQQRAQIWQQVMATAFNSLPQTSFFLAPGDIVQRPYEAYYKAFLSAPITKTLPSALLEASHDDDKMEKELSVFHQHFFQPTANSPTEPHKGFFWFKQGDVLFVSADPFNIEAVDPRPYIAQAVEQFPDTKWRIFTIHYSYYAAAFHANASTSPILRQQLTPLLDNMGFDLVIFGHDHAYLRTPQLLNDQVVATTPIDNATNSALNPQGAVYLTANSSSGSKYYSLKEDIHSRYYTAHVRQANTPSFINIDIDGNDLRIQAYEVDNDNQITLFDQYHIRKTGVRPVQSHDYDSDGVANDEDAFPFDPTEWLDTDGDGIGNNADPDDDNDGVPDHLDADPLDSDVHSTALPLDAQYKGSATKESVFVE